MKFNPPYFTSFFIQVLITVCLFWSCGHTIGDPDVRKELVGSYEGTCSVISGIKEGHEYPISIKLFSDEYIRSQESLFLNDGVDDIMIEIIDRNNDDLTFIINGSLRLDNFEKAYQYFGYVGFHIMNGSKYHGKLVKNDNQLTYFIETDYVNDDLDSLNAVYQVIAFKAGVD